MFVPSRPSSDSIPARSSWGIVYVYVEAFSPGASGEGVTAVPPTRTVTVSSPPVKLPFAASRTSTLTTSSPSDST